MSTYDRYQTLRGNGKIDMMPNIILDKKDSDRYEIYRCGHTRLDIISNKYYGNPQYWWLILMANPEYGSMEFEIPNNSKIRIPYPLDTTINEYINKIENHISKNR